MLKSYYAVIDTNVIVSALLTKNENSPTLQVMRAVLSGEIIPLFHQYLLEEYEEVLYRSKFHLKGETIERVLSAISYFGLEVSPVSTNEVLMDPDDIIFYEVAMAKRYDNAYLVTGNAKHYPVKEFIISPAEMMKLIYRSL